MEFYLQSNSVINSLKYPKSKSLALCLTELFQMNTEPSDSGTIIPLSNHIILKIVGFQGVKIRWKLKMGLTWQEKSTMIIYNLILKVLPNSV